MKKQKKKPEEKDERIIIAGEFFKMVEALRAKNIPEEYIVYIVHGLCCTHIFENLGIKAFQRLVNEFVNRVVDKKE